jgi:hypothetical protein
VSLREVEDEVPDARDGDERAGAGVPELVEERIPCCSETTTGTLSGKRRREKHRVDQIWTRTYLLRGSAAAP